MKKKQLNKKRENKGLIGLVILIVLLPIVLVGKDIIDYSKFAIYHENLPRIYKKDYECDVVKTEDSIECLIINLDKICRNPEKYKINDCSQEVNEKFGRTYLNIIKYIESNKSYNLSKYYQIAQIIPKDINNKYLGISILLDEKYPNKEYIGIRFNKRDENIYTIVDMGVHSELDDFES